MGDPLSAIMCVFFMEDLERKALTAAPKRHVDDIFEKVQSGHTQKLTDHLKTLDSTGRTTGIENNFCFGAALLQRGQDDWSVLRKG